MTQLIQSNGGSGIEPVPLDVPVERVERYLERGWVLADGEDYTKPTPQSEGRTLTVNEGLVPSTHDGEDTKVGTGVDTGLPLGANDVVKTPIIVDGRQVQEVSATGAVKTGLSGKSKEILMGIATAEGVAFDPEASKPVIKAAIEEARGESAEGESEEDESGATGA